MDKKDLLVHIDIIGKGNRFWTLAKNIINTNNDIILSYHSQMEIGNEIRKGFLGRGGKEQVLKTVTEHLKDINENDIFEIGFFIEKNNKLIISKICFRIKDFVEDEDLIVVLGFNKGLYKIRTVWLNNAKDNHKTLDKTKYVSIDDFSKMLSGK